MHDQPPSAPETALSDATGTFALILNIVAVIAFALFVAACGIADGGFAVTAGVVALVGFTVSVTAFMVDGNRLVADEVVASVRAD